MNSRTHGQKNKNKTLSLVWAFFSPTGFVECEAVKWQPG
jgi:hypothetical protein